MYTVGECGLDETLSNCFYEIGYLNSLEVIRMEIFMENFVHPQKNRDSIDIPDFLEF